MGTRNVIKRVVLKRPEKVGGYMTISLRRKQNGYGLYIGNGLVDTFRTKTAALREFGDTVKLYKKHSYKKRTWVARKNKSYSGARSWKRGKDILAIHFLARDKKWHLTYLPDRGAAKVVGIYRTKNDAINAAKRYMKAHP